MTVRLIAPNGVAKTVYIAGARSESSAIRTAQKTTGTDWQPAWVLPGDARWR